MSPLKRRVLLAIYTLSGAAGLVFEVALQRELSRAFGVTAWASATVLAAYMAGSALGARLFGRLADRLRNPVLLYALLEAGIGAAALLTPVAAPGLIQLFSHLATGHALGSAYIAVLRLVLALAFALLPATLMGGTFPAISSGLARLDSSGETPRRGVARLYALNLLGAVLGAAGSTYGLLPEAGLSRTLGAGATLNFLAAVGSFLLLRKASAPAAAQESQAQARPLLLGAAAGSGLLTFAYEVVWTHLVAIVIGSSAYAFGLMLATFLLGLTVGSLITARLDEKRLTWPTLGILQLGASLAVGATLPLWNQIPLAFAGLGPHVHSFWGRELVRASACLLVLLAPSLLLGMFYPALLRLTAREGRVGNTVGGMTALNTLGAVAGSLGAGFLLLPTLGSRTSLELLAVAGNGFAALCFRKRPVAQVTALAAAAAILLIPRWDLAALASGANVYFTIPSWTQGDVVFARESVESGLTTVIESPPGSDHKTLLTNGKFQGNNQGEMIAQLRFSQVPILINHGYQRALLIGLGTGTSLSVLAAQPFQEVEAAELSQDIVKAARLHFGALNGHVLDSDRVHLRYADGRNFLLLSRSLYDLVTIEVTSIWIAGEADLYNREFYHLVREHLAPHGVMQQWVQLHHMRTRSLAVILETVRQELPHVVLFVGGSQGQIIASREPISIDYEGLTQLNEKLLQTPATAGVPGRDLLTLYGELVLDEQGVDRFISEVASQRGLRPEELVSTDDNLYLEYQTPRGNVLDAHSDKQLVAEISRFGPGVLPLERADAPGARAHIAGARQVGTGKLAEALPDLNRAVELGAPAARLRDRVLKQIAAQAETPTP